MNIIKKNIISVICGVIAILAIVASIFPLGGYVENLQANLDKSKSTYDTLDGLRTKTRQLPSLSPDNATQQPLDTFPNPKAIEKGQGVVKEVEKQSLGMRDTAVKMNRHDQLAEGALPNPRPPADFKFRNLYVPLLKFGPNGELPQLAVQMKAGIPPSQQDVMKALEEMKIKITETELVKLPNGSVANQQEVTDRINQRMIEIPNEMRQSVAEKSLVYISLDTFDMHPKIAGAGRPDAVDIWWAQVALWIQQDIAAAILATNKNAKNIIEAPIKHLVQIRVTPQYVLPGGAPPPADPAAADAAITKVPLVSATARASNALYDVVHFNLVLNMEAAHVPAFLRELSRNRFITPTEVSLRTAVAPAVQGDQAPSYIYGPAPVVTVQMKGEALFLRQWTVPLMPALIKRQLGIPETPAPGAPGAAPAAPTAAAQ